MKKPKKLSEAEKMRENLIRVTAALGVPWDQDKNGAYTLDESKVFDAMHELIAFYQPKGEQSLSEFSGDLLVIAGQDKIDDRDRACLTEIARVLSSKNGNHEEDKPDNNPDAEKKPDLWLDGDDQLQDCTQCGCVLEYAADGYTPRFTFCDEHRKLEGATRAT